MTRYDTLPNHMRESIQAYIEDGRPPGDFLRAVLENNLIDAYSYADHLNIAFMREWASWLYNEAPELSRGSRENVDAWIKAGGSNGIEKTLAVMLETSKAEKAI